MIVPNMDKMFINRFNYRKDYYEIIKEDKLENVIDDGHSYAECKSVVVDDKRIDSDKCQKIFLEKKKDKIVIRDPKHSEYKFIIGYNFSK